MPSESARLIDAVIAGAATPLLKAAGYRKRGRRFVAGGVGVERVVEFQASRWNDASSTQFTANLDVRVPSFVPLYTETVLGGRVVSMPAVISERIGPLAYGRDRWWTLASEAEVGPVGVEVSAALLDYALPYLAPFDGLASLRSRLEAGAAPGVASIQRMCLAWMLVEAGERARAGSLLEDLVRSSCHPGYQARVLALGQRLGLTPSPP